MLFCFLFGHSLITYAYDGEASLFVRLNRIVPFAGLACKHLCDRKQTFSMSVLVLKRLSALKQAITCFKDWLLPSKSVEAFYYVHLC
jgi:hypothetical protein